MKYQPLRSLNRHGRLPQGSGLPSGVCSFGGWNVGFSSALNAAEEGDDTESVSGDSHRRRRRSTSFLRAVREEPLSKVIKVFEEMKEKEAQGVKSYLAVMRACSREGNLPMLVKFMKEMEDAGVPADKYVYNTYIHAFAKTGDLDKALEISDQMQARGIPHDGVTYRSLMIVAAAGKQLDKVKEFFTKAVESEPNDVRNYNFMMTAYDKASTPSTVKENAVACVELLKELKGKKIQPDTHTYQHLMKACAKAGMMEEAMGYMDEAVTSGAGLRLVMYDIQMESLAESGISDEDLETKFVNLFLHMDKNKLKATPLSFEHAIKLISKRSNIKAAMAFCDRLRKEGFKPAGPLLTGKLMCIQKMGEEGTSPEECLSMATTTLNEMMNMRPSLTGYAVLFGILDRADALDKALEHWAEFVNGGGDNRRRRADERMIESMMNLYLKNDKADEAMKLFDEMEKHGGTPRLKTFHIVMGHLAEKGDKENAAKAHTKMQEAKVDPDEKLLEAMKKLELV